MTKEHVHKSRGLVNYPLGVISVIGILVLLIKTSAVSGTNGRIAFFNVSMNSSLLLRQNVIDLSPNSVHLGFSFKTCSQGQLLYQTGASGDFLSVNLVNKTLEFRWRTNGQEDNIHVGSALTEGEWFYVEIKKTLGNLKLKIMRGSNVLKNILLANDNLRTNLLGLSLSGSPGVYVGRKFTGCVMEGPRLQFRDNNLVQAINIIWNNTHCPMSSCRKATDTTSNCFTIPCKNGGTCIDGPGTNYTCRCPHLFNGTNCENDLSVSGCAASPCLNQGTCEPKTSGSRNYQCTCIPGYTGVNCQTNINDCLAPPKKCGDGQCIDGVNSYTCNCTGTGYTGTHCNTDIFECDLTPGLCGNGTCYNTIGSYSCECTPGYDSSKNCKEELNECDSNPCENGAQCQDLLNDFRCTCPTGYTDKNCGTNIDDCVNVTCPGSNSECKDLINAHQCVCQPGFTGTPPNCVDYDECSSNPCKNGATCVNGRNKYECRCVDGYRGDNCGEDINECASNPCDTGQICDDQVNGYRCACPAGYTGTNCSTEIDECVTNNQPCKNGATCNDLLNGYNCTCATGWTGTHCVIIADECHPSPCINGATCSLRSPNNYTCSCVTGFTGRNCEINIDDCSPNPCQNGGACVDGVNEYTCNCTSDWMGKTCADVYDACAFGPCKNGATCSTTKPSHIYTCQCPTGFTGQNCEENIDDCKGHNCQLPQVCFDHINNYTCDCPTGYTGENCSIDIDECANTPCQNGATCHEGLGNYTCTCQQSFLNLTRYGNGQKLEYVVGFNGKNCENSINECSYSPSICMNNGACDERYGGYSCSCGLIPGSEGSYSVGNNCELVTSYCLSMDIVQKDPPACKHEGTCIPNKTAFTCVCVPGYTGTRCEHDIDECESSPCQYGGTCQNLVNRYNCSCIPGITGTNCETDINECESDPCLHGGRCNDSINMYTCDCFDTGFNGTNCELNIDDCAPQPCLNGGTCNDMIKAYNCSCNEGYNGTNCEVDINECEVNPCQYGGTCLQRSNQTLYNPAYDLPGFGNFSYATAAGYSCLCIPGITGKNCEQDIDECESSPCQYGGTCKDLINGYTCSCIPGITGPNCEKDIDECESNPCLHGGRCNDSINMYTCDCLGTGFKGTTCETEINECDLYKPCQNGAACVDKIADYDCTCPAVDEVKEYSGKNCTFRLTKCLNNTQCLNSARCIPFLINEATGQEDFRCRCERGFTGKFCGFSTTGSFYGDAHITKTINSSAARNRIFFSFRTTLPEGILFVWNSDYQTTKMFMTVELFNGKIKISYLTGSSTSSLQVSVIDIDYIVNDARWYDVEIMKNETLNIQLILPTPAQPCSTCIRSNLQYQESSPNNDVWFGSAKNEFRISKTLSKEKFIGCMRDISIDGVELQTDGLKDAVNVKLNCPRTDQCRPDPCNSNGKCNDQWINYTCTCYRPHLGPVCNYTFVPATFSYQNIKSWASFTIPSQALQSDVDLSLFVRTREKDGLIFYLGKSRTAFITLEIFKGGFASRAVFCNSKLFAQANSSLYNNGYQHFVRIKYASRTYTISVNKTEVYKQTNFPASGSCTFQPDKLYFGGKIPVAQSNRRRRSDQVVDASNIDNLADYKGTIQDAQLNNYVLQFYSPSDPSVVTQSLLRVSDSANLTQGEVSDDVCALQAPCKHNGTCKNEFFNDFSCKCGRGFLGKDCSIPDFCHENSCPPEAQCHSLLDGFECRGTGTFNGLTSVTFNANNLNSNGIIKKMSLEFKTLVRNGLLLYFTSDQYFLKLGIVGGKLRATCKFGGSAETIEVDHYVSDKKWYKFTLQEETTNEIKLSVETMESVALKTESRTLQNPAISFSDLIKTGTSRTLTLGTNLNAGYLQFYKGCLREVRVGGILLPFFKHDQFVNFTSAEYFVMETKQQLVIGCVAGDGCSFSKCQFGSSCVPDYYAYGCKCLSGYRGTWCETNINDCPPNVCENSGKCVDTVDNYFCNCRPGYTGTKCETTENFCQNNPCRNNASCNNLTGDYSCTCPDNYTDKNCSTNKYQSCQANSPCENSGTCENISVKDTSQAQQPSFNCTCPAGYKGDICETKIDFCQTDPCENNGNCTSLTTGYSCSCPQGFTGTRCETDIDQCQSNQCVNGACVDIVTTYTCNCTDGWTGEKCNQDFNECTAAQPCQNSAKCNNIIGGFNCDCTGTGYKGTDCSEDVDECTELTPPPCQNGANCTNSVGDYNCSCAYGYKSKNCDVPDCSLVNCENGGTCKLVDSGKHWQCDCVKHYYGELCGTPGPCIKTPCNESNTKDCVQNTTADSRVCNCQTGWEGETCDQDIDECKQDPCQHGSTCQNFDGGYRCVCTPGYSGVHCETDIDECASDPCQNGGTCSNLINEFKCNCTPGFTNTTCMDDINECLPADPCKNGGQCVNDYGSFRCDCGKEFIGTYCELKDPDYQKITQDNSLAIIIGPAVAAVLLIIVIGVIVFLMFARSKRATRGTYSPRRQEVTGSRVELGNVMKPPPEERLI